MRGRLVRLGSRMRFDGEVDVMEWSNGGEEGMGKHNQVDLM